MCGINYDPLQSHDEAACCLVMKRIHLWWWSLRAPLPGQMDLKHCTRLEVGNSILYACLSLPSPRLLQFLGCEKYLRAFVFLRKSIASIWCIKWRARMRKSKSRSFNPSSPLFLERQMAGKEWPENIKIFRLNKNTNLTCGNASFNSPAMLKKHPLSLGQTHKRQNIQFPDIDYLWKKCWMAAKQLRASVKKTRKLKGFPKKKFRVFGSRIEIGKGICQKEISRVFIYIRHLHISIWRRNWGRRSDRRRINNARHHR